MKVNLESRVGGITGKAGDVVYCYYRHYKVMYARRYVYPTLSEQNRKTGSITANLHRLHPSEGYIADLRDYVWRYNMLPVSQRVPLRAWNNAYLRLMHEMAKADDTIDLRSITREFIYDNALPCITVKRAVEAGLLPKVHGWEEMTSEM